MSSLISLYREEKRESSVKSNLFKSLEKERGSLVSNFFKSFFIFKEGECRESSL